MNINNYIFAHCTRFSDGIRPRASRKHLPWLLPWTLATAIALPAAFGQAALRAEIDPNLKQQILTTTDEDFLISLIEKEGDSNDDIFLKNLTVKRLITVGSEKCVPALLKLLNDEAQSYNARFALETLESPEINPALEKLVVEMKGRIAIDLVASLGARRDANAVPVLKGILDSGSAVPEMRCGIYTALGFIATPEAGEVLEELGRADKALDAREALVLGNAMVFAGTILEQEGHLETAERLYHIILNVPERFPIAVVRAAKIRALAAFGDRAAPAVAEKLASSSSDERETARAAIRLLTDAAGEKLVAAVADAWDSLPEKTEVLVALGGRGDTATRTVFLPLLREKAQESHDTALAALQTYHDIEPAGVQDALALADAVYAPGSGLADLKEPVTRLFWQINSPNVDSWLVEKLRGEIQTYEASGSTQAEAETVDNIIELLRLVQWRRPEGIYPMLAEFSGKAGMPNKLKKALFGAMAETVPLESLTDLIERGRNTVFEDEKPEDAGTEAQRILNLACERLPKAGAVQQVVALFNSSEPDGRARLIEVLREIGGEEAVETVAKAAHSLETMDAATRALGEWNKQEDMEAVAAACLELAKTIKQEKYRIRAVKGFIRVPRQFSISASKRIAMADTAFEMAQRNEDRALVFDIFSRIVDVRSVEAAMKYADQPSWRAMACETAVKIGEKINLAADTSWGWYTESPEDLKAEEEERLGNRAKLVSLMERVAELAGSGELADRAKVVADRNQGK